MRNPEGEANILPLRLQFDRRLKLELDGSRITPPLDCLRIVNSMMPLA